LPSRREVQNKRNAPAFEAVIMAQQGACVRISRGKNIDLGGMQCHPRRALHPLPQRALQKPAQRSYAGLRTRLEICMARGHVIRIAL
jgi:hypothetical protein